jgi:hypothetical protein
VYLRFVIHHNDPDSGRRQGLFHAMAGLRNSGALSADDEVAYDTLYKWFSNNLKRPQSFARSAKPHAKRVALSWFKVGATKHIDQMRRVAQILHAYGVEVVELKTLRPGYVVYEDEHQIAAEPFADTPV